MSRNNLEKIQGLRTEIKLGLKWRYCENNRLWKLNNVFENLINLKRQFTHFPLGKSLMLYSLICIIV